MQADCETREERGHKIDQRFINDVRRAYNLRGGETDASVVQRIGNAIAELNAQRTTLGDPPGPRLIQSASVPPEPPTLSDEDIEDIRQRAQCGDDIEFAEVSALCDTVAALRAEVAVLVSAIDNELVLSGELGTFKLGDDPKAALHKLACWNQSVGAYFAARAEEDSTERK